MSKSQNELRFGRKNNTIGSRNYSPNKQKSPKTENELGENNIPWEKGVLDDETI